MRSKVRERSESRKLTKDNESLQAFLELNGERDSHLHPNIVPDNDGLFYSQMLMQEHVDVSSHGHFVVPVPRLVRLSRSSIVGQDDSITLVGKTLSDLAPAVAGLGVPMDEDERVPAWGRGADVGVVEDNGGGDFGLVVCPVRWHDERSHIGGKLRGGRRWLRAEVSIIVEGPVLERIVEEVEGQENFQLLGLNLTRVKQ